MVWWKFTCQSFRYLTTCAIACIITSFGGWKFPDGSFNPFLQIHENFSLAFERVKKKRNKRITHLPPKIWPNSYTFFFYSALSGLKPEGRHGIKQLCWPEFTHKGQEFAFKIRNYHYIEMSMPVKSLVPYLRYSWN